QPLGECAQTLGHVREVDTAKCLNDLRALRRDRLAKRAAGLDHGIDQPLELHGSRPARGLLAGAQLELLDERGHLLLHALDRLLPLVTAQAVPSRRLDSELLDRTVDL